MFDDNSGEGWNNDSTSGYSSLVFRTQRVLAVSYALEERLRATGHLTGFAAVADQHVVHPRRR